MAFPNRTSSRLLGQIASEKVIDQSYLWLCEQRKHYPVNADIWHFRRQWSNRRNPLIAALGSGSYRFSPQQRLVLKNGKTIHLWSAQDALVQKAMAIVLGTKWPISPRCTHIKGNGGLKGALRWLRGRLPHNSFVFRSDIKAYYENINQACLLKQLDRVVPEKDVMRLMVQVIERTVEWGGTFRTIRRGIGRGSPLSPLFAALYMKPLDDAMDRAGIAYVRYMDDWVILTSSRHRLRRAIRRVNITLNALSLSKHPDKTWMGKIDRGFDFLGYHHTRVGLTPARATTERFRQRLTRLYEQGASNERIGAYRKRWWRWVTAGLAGNEVQVPHRLRRLLINWEQGSVS